MKIPHALRPKNPKHKQQNSGKESTDSARDPDLIPGLGRSPGEGIASPLQYSWASLVAQMVKNLPAVGEPWVWYLGWEDPLEEHMAIHCSILAWGIPWTEEPGRLQSTGSRRVGHDRVTKHSISNRRNIVTSSIKTLRMVPIRKKKKNLKNKTNTRNPVGIVFRGCFEWHERKRKQFFCWSLLIFTHFTHHLWH